MTVLWLPLCSVFQPLTRVFPRLEQWRIRTQLPRWIQQVRSIDERLSAGSEPCDFQGELLHLTRLEAYLAQLTAPASLRDEIDRLRVHLAFVVDRLWKREQLGFGLPRRAA